MKEVDKEKELLEHEKQKKNIRIKKIIRVLNKIRTQKTKKTVRTRSTSTRRKSKVENKEALLEIKEYKFEKFEIKEHKPEIKEAKIEYEGYGGFNHPGGPVEQRLAALEAAMTKLLHFIPENLRSDLTQGALKQEADAPNEGAKPEEHKPSLTRKARTSNEPRDIVTALDGGPPPDPNNPCVSGKSVAIAARLPLRVCDLAGGSGHYLGGRRRRPPHHSGAVRN